MTGFNSNIVTAVGRCATCGKTCYVSRSQAKLAARRMKDRGMNAYRCGEFWHFGHASAQMLAIWRST